MLERLKALEEQIDSHLSWLRATVNASVGNPTSIVNSVDNFALSMGANVCRSYWPFVDYHVVSEDMMFIGPIGAILALITFAIDYWFVHRYRDDWEAYWSLEIERFEKLYIDLQQLTPSSQISAKTQADLAAIYFALLKYLHKHQEFEKLFGAEKEADEETHEEKLLKLKELHLKLQKVLVHIGQLIGHERAREIAREAEAPDEKSFKGFSASRKQFDEMYEEADKKAKAPKVAGKDPSLQQPPAERNWFDKALTAIPDTAPYNIVFAYSWNYWGVFFFTLWGIPDAFSVVPLTWGFLALIAPVAYLFYKEYEFYQKEKVAVIKDKVKLNATIQSRENQKELKIARDIYQKNHKDRQNELLPLRVFGWAFVALVASLSVGMLVSNYLIGVAVFVGISLLGYAVTAVIDNQFKNNYLMKNLPDGADHTGEKTSSLERRKEAFFRRYSQKWMRLKAQRAVWAQRFNKVFGFDLEEKQKINSLLNVELSDSEDESSGMPLNKLAPTDSSINSPNQAETYITKTEKVRRVIAPVVNFFVGYMLGIIIGFATTDFLSHFMGTMATGVAANAIVGVLGLILGASFSRRAWLVDEEHRAELQSFRESPDYCKKHRELEQLNYDIPELRDSLKKFIEAQKLQASRSGNVAIVKSLEDKLKLIEAPEKPISQAKILKTLRKCFNVLVNISSAMLMSRALLVMGFAGIFAFSGGSIALFGMDAASPFGIAVFSIAALLLILKAGNETYLQFQKEKELRQVKYVDLKLEHAKEENAFLNQVNNLLRNESKASSIALKPSSAHGENRPDTSDEFLMPLTNGKFSNGKDKSDDRHYSDSNFSLNGIVSSS